jgi:hypothetical protein
MTMIETRDAQSPAPSSEKGINTPEFTELVKVNKPEIPEAYWGIVKILGLPASKEANLHREKNVLPVVRFAFKSADGKRTFEAHEGPLVNNMIKTDEELEELTVDGKKLQKRRKQDYRKFRDRLIANSIPFWSIEGREDQEYKDGRIEHELPVVVKAIEADPEISVPDDIDINDYARQELRRFFSTRLELVVTLEDNNQDSERETSISEPSVIIDATETQKAVEDKTLVGSTATGKVISENAKAPRKRGRLYGTLAVGVPLALIGVNQATHTAPQASVSYWLGGQNSEDERRVPIGSGYELGMDENGIPRTATVTNPENSAVAQSPQKTEVPKENIQRTEDAKRIEKMLLDTPWLIETVKTKAAVIADVADAQKIDAKFLAALIQSKSAGNSRTGDHDRSDSYGLVLISLTEANKAGLSKEDLFNDRKALVLASRMLKPRISIHGLDTPAAVSQVVKDFEGEIEGSEHPAWISAWMHDTNPVAVTEMWSKRGANPRIISDARKLQGLTT